MTSPDPRAPRDQESWARPVDRLTTTARTTGQDTVTGRRVSGPVQGFGQMWQKTFSVRVPADEHPPEAVVAHWKAAFPTFWPKGAAFYAPLAGITPGRGRAARGAARARLARQDVHRRARDLR